MMIVFSLPDGCRYDSLTGVPSTQKAIGFEKGSILFNIGSLYTQLGCKRVSVSFHCKCLMSTMKDVTELCKMGFGL